MQRFFLFLLCCACFAAPASASAAAPTSAVSVPPAASADNVPKVIPALRTWKSASGVLHLPSEGRIAVSPADSAALFSTAAILAEDLSLMFGMDYKAVCAKPGKKDICLTLGGTTEGHGEEAYRLRIGAGVTISAQTQKGVFWGTRTLLQMLYNQPEGLMKGETLDWPEHGWRGFMIDVGRKFFTLDYLKQYVRILSFYKMNVMQVHLNDNGFVQYFDNDWNKTYAAFRLESERFPGLTAKDGSYGKDEFRDFQKMAAGYGVMIVPEIDVPAHSLAFTHYNPRLAADRKEYGMDHLDLYKQEVYDFLDELFTEYLEGDDPVFVGPFVHMGTDEYNRSEAEQFRHFTNHYINLISSFGKTPFLWGSLKFMGGETPVDVDKCFVNAWNYDWLDVETALKEGYKGVVNICDAYLYIVPAAHYYYDFLNLKMLYENWSAEKMNAGDPTSAVGNENFHGAMFAVWNDHVGNGISQYDVHYRTFPAVQVVADKLWKGNNAAAVPYEDFAALSRNMPDGPGVNLSARLEEPFSLAEEVQLSGTDVVATGVPEVGYPYRVEFEILSADNPVRDAILFRGPHSEFIANWQGTGKFAFRRDGYEFVFHKWSLPVGTWTKIAVEGDHRGTSLYVDGVLTERLEGRRSDVYNKARGRVDSIWHQETLVFPLSEIGAEVMGFKGSLRNLSVNIF